MYPYCYECFCEWDDYCWYYCPYSLDCEYDTFYTDAWAW